MKKTIFMVAFLMTASISSDFKPVHPTQAGLLQQKSPSYLMHYILFGRMKVLMA